MRDLAGTSTVQHRGDGIVSRYPDNPFWCQVHDHPIKILTQGDWDEANAAGHLTEEHIVDRLTDIANHALGNGADLGFDEEGFLLSLVADGLKLEGGVTLQVNSNDHPPPHVHVLLRSQPQLKLRIRLDNGEPLDDPDSVRAKELRRFSELVVEHNEVLTAWWMKKSAA